MVHIGLFVIKHPNDEFFIVSGNPEHDCLRPGFFHFISAGAGFFGAHTTFAGKTVPR